MKGKNPLGLFSWLRKKQVSVPSPLMGENVHSEISAEDSQLQVIKNPVPITQDQKWVMPKYQGVDICDWIPEISRLKKEQEFDKALSIANGAMGAMIEVALKNPDNAMERYVIEVALIQHKIKDYAAVVKTIESWFHYDIPAPREDMRVDLQKRLAKAKELLAKQEGRDSSLYHQEWKRLVELSKTTKKSLSSSASSTGKSRATGVTNNGKHSYKKHTPKFVAPVEILSEDVFVAVDFETANRISGASACQVSLVKVVNGEVVDQLTTLLKPPPGLDKFEFTYLHKISSRHVRKSPSWLEVAGCIQDFIGDSTVYAHNASFDSKVWRELDEYYGLNTLPQKFYCSYRTAEKLIPGLPNYKLPTVVSYCRPEYKFEHHKADADALACAVIVSALKDMARGL